MVCPQNAYGFLPDRFQFREVTVTTILMNGASRGFGLHAARRMLDDHPGLRLIVMARGDQPALPRTRVIRGDMASLASVREAAAAIGEPLDGYVGNAGVQRMTDTTTTADGLETTFAVNVIAHYLLIRSVTFTDNARIVITGSASHFGTFSHNLGLVPAPRWSTPSRLARPGAVGNGRAAYSTSKLGVVYLVHALARHRPQDVYTFNPGFVPGTGLLRYNRVGDFFWRHVLPHLPGANTVERAGAELAAVALGPRPAESGAYIDRSTVTPSSPESYDEAREDELWSDLHRSCTATA
jgi:NAD(P)-dependent dehydrogenase (short-subunit alcohol dehydrogenase family)